MVAVSVIVPLYKTEQFVERCLRSVMAQSFEDIEILCIDDCSPDKSAEIVERLMLEDSRIKLIRHDQNKGLGGASVRQIRCSSALKLPASRSYGYRSRPNRYRQPKS